MRYTEVSDYHKDLWIHWLLRPVVLVQKDTIYADLLSLVDKVHEEPRTLESLHFCFPVETIPLNTHITSVLQHSSFAASGWTGITLRGRSQTSYGSASVFIIFGRAICEMFVKMMQSSMVNLLLWKKRKRIKGKKIVSACWHMFYQWH